MRALQRVPNPTQYLSRAQVLDRYGGASPMWLHRRIINSGFPRGIHIGGGKLSLWKLEEIEQWENDPRNHIAPPLNVERLR